MTHTVIGFFRNSSDAYNAADILKDRGFDISNVDVSSGFGTTNDRRSDHDREDKSGKIGNFFRSLFSDDNDNAERYSKAAKDNSLVTVHASNHDEAERAADILDSCGAIDIDDGGSYTGSEAGGYSRNEAGVYGGNEGMLTDSEYDLRGSKLGDVNETDFHDRDLELERTPGFGAEGDLDVTDESLNSDQDIDRNDPGRSDFDKTRFSSDRDLDRSIPIIEEEVNVGKREVRRGGVRVRSRIIERPVEETLRLREERVRVERTPADREATDAELEGFQDETIEVHEYGEEPLVSKSSRVVEEVKVGKDVHEREETIREKARKTEVDVENLEDEEKIHRGRKR